MSEKYKNLALPFFAVLSVSLASLLIIVTLVRATDNQGMSVAGTPGQHMLDGSPFMFTTAKPTPQKSSSGGSHKSYSRSSGSKRKSLSSTVKKAALSPIEVSGTALVDGVPAPAGTVISLTDAKDPAKVVVTRTMSAADNSFDFTKVVAGSYRLKLTLPESGHIFWYAARSTEIFSTATIITKSKTVAFDVSPEGGHVIGKIHRPDGTPVEGIEVVARQDSSGGEQFTAHTQEDGTYCFGSELDCNLRLAGPSLKPGHYLVCAEDIDTAGVNHGEYCTAASLRTGWYTLLAGQDIEVPQDFGWPIEVKGKVTMSDGGAVADAKVELKPVGGGAALTVYADAAGNYSVDGPGGLKVGGYNVCATDKAGERQCYVDVAGSATVHVLPHSTTADIDIAITPGSSVTVKVADGDKPGAGGAGADGDAAGKNGAGAAGSGAAANASPGAGGVGSAGSAGAGGTTTGDAPTTTTPVPPAGTGGASGTDTSGGASGSSSGSGSSSAGSSPNQSSGGTPTTPASSGASTYLAPPPAVKVTQATPAG